MLAFLLRRFLFALLLVVVVSSAAFVLTRLAPGCLGMDEDPTMAPAVRERLMAERGCDQPIATHYAAWAGAVARGDFGRSFLFPRPVSDLLGERAANTALLALLALLLATVLGIPLGVYTGSGVGARPLAGPGAVHRLPVGAAAGRVAGAGAGGGPHRLVPGGGHDLGRRRRSAVARLAGRRAPPCLVPAVALALPLAATLERLQAQSVREALRETFVTASRARGVAEARVLARHAWPVSLRAVLAFYGLMIGALFSGSFIVEVITAWPGLGRLMFDALRARDLFLVAGAAAAGAAFLAAGTLAADVLLAWLDPRVRAGERA